MKRGTRLRLPEVGSFLEWLPLLYVGLVPSLMFLTNIGERVYQDVFFLGVLLYAVVRRQADWSAGIVSIWIAWIGYVIWATLADYLGSGHLTSDWFRGGALLMLLPWFMAWARREDVRKAISLGLRLALLVATVVAVVQVYVLDVPRAHGSENANIFALLMAMYGVFVIHESLSRGSRATPIWVLLAIVPLVLSGSRTALVSFIVVLLLVLFIYRRQLPLKPALAGFAGVAIVVGLIGAPQIADRSSAFLATFSVEQGGAGELWREFVEMDFVSRAASPEGSDAMALKSEFKSSIGFRLVYWRTGWEVFRANPLSGVGSAEEMVEVGETLGMGSFFHEKHSHVHNTFLQHLVTGGLFKLLLLLLALSLPILVLWRHSQRERSRLVLFVTLVASLAGLTAVVFELHQFVFVYTLVMAYSLAGYRLGRGGGDGAVSESARDAAGLPAGNA